MHQQSDTSTQSCDRAHIRARRERAPVCGGLVGVNLHVNEMALSVLVFNSKSVKAEDTTFGVCVSAWLVFSYVLHMFHVCTHSTVNVLCMIMCVWEAEKPAFTILFVLLRILFWDQWAHVGVSGLSRLVSCVHYCGASGMLLWNLRCQMEFWRNPQ